MALQAILQRSEGRGKKRRRRNRKPALNKQQKCEAEIQTVELGLQSDGSYGPVHRQNSYTQTLTALQSTRLCTHNSTSPQRSWFALFPLRASVSTSYSRAPIAHTRLHRNSVVINWQVVKCECKFWEQKSDRPIIQRL